MERIGSYIPNESPTVPGKPSDMSRAGSTGSTRSSGERKARRDSDNSDTVYTVHTPGAPSSVATPDVATSDNSTYKMGKLFASINRSLDEVRNNHHPIHYLFSSQFIFKIFSISKIFSLTSYPLSSYSFAAAII